MYWKIEYDHYTKLTIDHFRQTTHPNSTVICTDADNNTNTQIKIKELKIKEYYEQRTKKLQNLV